jgi:hypothetical protein
MTLHERISEVIGHINSLSESLTDFNQRIQTANSDESRKELLVHWRRVSDQLPDRIAELARLDKQVAEEYKKS